MLPGQNLQKLVFKKASKSQYVWNQCVEVAVTGEGALVRDSKDPSGPTLAFNTGEWEAFLDGVKKGEFDLSP